jgi:hypothetical protein
MAYRRGNPVHGSWSPDGDAPAGPPPDVHAASTAPAQRSPSLDVNPQEGQGNSDARNRNAGLLVGTLLGLFTSGHSFLAVIVTGTALGAAWGAAFGYLAHARTRGERDFSSVRGLTVTRYDLIAREGTVDRARLMLSDAGLLPETANEW